MKYTVVQSEMAGFLRKLDEKPHDKEPYVFEMGGKKWRFGSSDDVGRFIRNSRALIKARLRGRNSAMSHAAWSSEAFTLIRVDSTRPDEYFAKEFLFRDILIGCSLVKLVIENPKEALSVRNRLGRKYDC